MGWRNNPLQELGPEQLAYRPLVVEAMKIESPHGEVAEVQAEDFADLAKPSEDMPLPTDLRTLVLLGIFVVLCFYTMYFTREILDPDLLRLCP